MCTLLCTLGATREVASALDKSRREKAAWTSGSEGHAQSLTWLKGQKPADPFLHHEASISPEDAQDLGEMLWQENSRFIDAGVEQRANPSNL